MALLKLKDFDPNYRQTLVDDGLIGLSVYADTTDEKIGSVKRKIYEETHDIHKEAVWREEVRIRKEVERDTVETQETLRP